MDTETQLSEVPPEVRADMHAIAAAMSEGRKPDPELVQRIRERAAKASAAVFARHGLLDIGVGYIREVRGPLPDDEIPMTIETQTQPPTISPEERADMDEIMAALMEKRKPDPEVAKRVQARAEKATARNLALHGVQDIGVGYIRELRGPLPN